MIYSYTHPLKFPETNPLPTHLSELDFEFLYVDVQHEEGEDFEADQGQRSTGHAKKFRHVITLTRGVRLVSSPDPTLSRGGARGVGTRLGSALASYPG